MSRDPQAEDRDRFPLWICFPGDTQWRKREGGRLTAVLNELGADGWELVGPPTTANGVFTYKASTDVYHDKAVWMEQTFWFKRPA
jgi:hypothetical protein